jgi:hypothetical protein
MKEYKYIVILLVIYIFHLNVIGYPHQEDSAVMLCMWR